MVRRASHQARYCRGQGELREAGLSGRQSILGSPDPTFFCPHIDETESIGESELSGRQSRAQLSVSPFSHLHARISATINGMKLKQQPEDFQVEEVTTLTAGVDGPFAL